MSSKLLKYLVLPAMLFASACTTIKSDTSTSDPFKIQLAKNYKNFSDSHGVKYTIYEQKTFKYKARTLDRGREVLPQGIARVALSGNDRGDLENARLFLNEELDKKTASAVKLADLQFLFDCWVDQENHWRNRVQVESCDYAFQAARKNLYAQNHVVKHDCVSSHKIYFKFDDYKNIDHAGMNVIKDFAEMAKKDHEKILSIGHTDKVGTQKYNDHLSMHRARKVADELVAHGIAKNRIKLVAMGEKHATNDDAASRFVSLFLENDKTMDCWKGKQHEMKKHCHDKKHSHMGKHHHHHDEKHHNDEK